MSENSIYIYGLCRCCHARGNFKSLGVAYVLENNYAVMLRDTFGVLICPAIGESSASTYTICESCIVSLQDAARFKQQVMCCEEKFSDFVNFGQDNLKVKIEPIDEDIKNENGYIDNQSGLLKVELQVGDERKHQYPGQSSGLYNEFVAVRGSDCDADWVPPPQYSQVPEVPPKDEKPDIKTEPCPICDKKFSYQGLSRHMRTHRETKVYTCHICQIVFKSGRDLTDHLKSKHVVDKMFPCNSCSTVLESAKLLKKHLNDHYNKELVKCDKCEKEYTRAALKEHMRKIHNETYICDICKKVFKQKHNMISHLFTHTGVKPHSCETCGKSFQFERQLRCHVSVIHLGEKPYECRFCPKRFPGKYPRELHERQHTGNRPFVCTVCEKTFASNGTLTLHMITHSNERPFSCAVCGQCFPQLGNLKMHERTHSQEKLYSCEICAKAFNHKGNLKTHMRIHTGETPYRCEICKEQFRFEISLQRHIRRHTGEKFHCQVCDKQVSGNGKYKHLKKHRERGEMVPPKWLPALSASILGSLAPSATEAGASNPAQSVSTSAHSVSNPAHCASTSTYSVSNPAHSVPNPAHCVSTSTYRISDPAHSVPAPVHSVPNPAHCVSTSTYRISDPAHSVPAPVHSVPNPAHCVSTSTYRISDPAHSVPAPVHSVSDPAHSASTSTYSISNPAHSVPGPAHSVPASAHSISTSTYSISNPAHSVPGPAHSVPASAHSISTSTYSISNPAHSVPNPAHSVPNPAHSVPNPAHSVPAPSAPVPYISPTAVDSAAVASV